MTRWATGLVSFVILFHCAAFLLEACFWMQPSVHEAVLPRLTGLALPAAHEQARILEALFVSQGFYNLFLASAGMVGLVLSRRGSTAVGHALCCYACLTAVGAGIVLACSTRAYVGASLQAVPAAIALSLLRTRSRELRV